MARRSETHIEPAARGPYKTGQETRQALLTSALALFAARGFDAASTREIAIRAEMTIPAISYHFGSKQGLYLACADYIIERYRERMQQPLAEIRHQLSQMTSAEARSTLKGVLVRLVDMLDDGASDPWLAFMLREMGGPSAAHDRLYAALWEPGLALVAALIARTRGRATVFSGDRLDALLLLSTPSVFAYAQSVALRFAVQPAIDEHLREMILDRLSDRIDGL